MKQQHLHLERATLVRLFSILFCLATVAGLSSCAPAQESEEVVVQNYVPPPWAPPYDNVSMVRYYYFPDYEFYYDVWDHQFWCLNGSDWVEYPTLPPAYAAVDLTAAFLVLIDRNVDHPWFNHDYYRQNYPHHMYDNYQDIVVRNRVIINTEPHHELLPRAYNENNNRVTFMQHPVGGPPPNQYHHVVHEVPITRIAPSMPKETHAFNYGGARNAAPAHASAPPASHGGGGGGGGKH